MSAQPAASPARAPRAVLPAELRVEPEAMRSVLVVALILVTGMTDAIGFTRLGGVFTRVMTANMVLLGVAAGCGDGILALHTRVAFAGYVVGGAHLAGSARDDGLWPRSMTLAPAAELLGFCGFAAGWEAAGVRPTGSMTLVLLGVNATALGIQSSAVLRLGVSGLSTTYLTGTLTGVNLARHPHADQGLLAPHRHPRRADRRRGHRGAPCDRLPGGRPGGAARRARRGGRRGLRRLLGRPSGPGAGDLAGRRGRPVPTGRHHGPTVAGRHPAPCTRRARATLEP
ncbi:MAG TPA: YoaK family protein [Acidimicrobiales bacterium]|nr:YoaK family protein [Acidimicrobiales bacterium]